MFVWVADTIVEGRTENYFITFEICDKIGKNKLGFERTYSRLSSEGNKTFEPSNFFLKKSKKPFTD